MRDDFADAAVLFDLDGTLIDTAGDLAAAMNHALSVAGLRPVNAERVRHLVGHGARAMLAMGFAESGGAAPATTEMDVHVGVFLDYYLAHIADESRPFPGVLEAVASLRADGLKVAICTNKREGPARLLIETLGVGNLFDAIVGMDTAGAAKPDPKPVRHCMRLMGRARGVFVGDSDTDIQAAKAAGMPTLVAEFGYGPWTLRGEALAAFAGFADLPTLVRKALDAG